MDNDEKYLVIISPGFPASEEDTTCLPSQQLLVKTLNRINPSIEIVILSYEYPFTDIAYRWYANEVIPFNGWKKGFWSKCLTFFSMYRAMQRIYREKKIIGILSFWTTAGAVIGKYFAKFHGLVHYAWILGQDARKKNRFIKFLSPRPEELIAMSPSLQREFQKNYKVKAKWIIPNAIDISMFSSEEMTRDIDILGVGSLIPLKEYNIFIRVIKSIQEAFPKIRAVICGKGPQQESLQALIKELDLTKNITLIGEQPHDVALMLMQRSKIFLHPSSYEGFSTVCLEALYAGAHVISFHNPKDSWINHWYIALGEADMTRIAQDLLEDDNLNHDPVLVYKMEDQADSVLKLFNESSTV
jgi:glycosyltransferase involved in cell wall biosynthesis